MWESEEGECLREGGRERVRVRESECANYLLVLGGDGTFKALGVARARHGDHQGGAQRAGDVKHRLLRAELLHARRAFHAPCDA